MRGGEGRGGERRGGEGGGGTCATPSDGINTST